MFLDEKTTLDYYWQYLTIRYYNSNFYDADNPCIAAIEKWIANWEWELSD